MNIYQTMYKLTLWSSLPMLIGFTLVSLVQSQQDPKTMTKISTGIVEPRPDPGSFTAQVRTLWRAGTKYGRVAESPDIQNHIQGLMIINEPDAWIINLLDRSGKHIIDPGPSLVVRLPIFPDQAVSTKFRDLEFGGELEFVSKMGARGSKGEAVNGRETERYEVTSENSKIVLWTDLKSRKPLRVSLVVGRQAETVEYLSFDDDLAFDPSLFRPPTGIAMQDAK
jgi:hypothetical protein